MGVAPTARGKPRWPQSGSEWLLDTLGEEVFEVVGDLFESGFPVAGGEDGEVVAGFSEHVGGCGDGGFDGLLVIGDAE